jgi:hypothetical protein
MRPKTDMEESGLRHSCGEVGERESERGREGGRERKERERESERGIGNCLIVIVICLELMAGLGTSTQELFSPSAVWKEIGARHYCKIQHDVSLIYLGPNTAQQHNSPNRRFESTTTTVSFDDR